MFYDPREGLRPPLTHNPINALVAPRPIGWISTISASGSANLAPFSYFNAVSADPAMVMFAPNAKPDGERKDTFRNLLEVPQFVANVVSAGFEEAMNATSADFDTDVDEFDAVGIAAVPSRNVRPPRVARAMAALECEVFQFVELPRSRTGRGSNLVIGTVVGIHIAEACIRGGAVDQLSLAQVARLGREDYTIVERIFEMQRPRS